MATDEINVREATHQDAGVVSWLMQELIGDVETMTDWKGSIIAEGLSDPTGINKFSVYKATITEANMPIDYEGHIGRWHTYDVRCSRDEIDALQPYILPGWYAHFWKENKIIVVYDDRQFELVRNDKSTWREAIAHGKIQGIPEEELDFPTD